MNSALPSGRPVPSDALSASDLRGNEMHSVYLLGNLFHVPVVPRAEVWIFWSSSLPSLDINFISEAANSRQMKPDSPESSTCQNGSWSVGENCRSGHEIELIGAQYCARGCPLSPLQMTTFAQTDRTRHRGCARGDRTITAPGCGGFHSCREQSCRSVTGGVRSAPAALAPAPEGRARAARPCDNRDR